jgi:hypothetical protein
VFFFSFDFATGSPHPSGAIAKHLRGEPLNELITTCTAKFVYVDREVSIGYLMKYRRCSRRYSAHHAGVVYNKFGSNALAEFNAILVAGCGI